jgi:hypothetical protein
VNEEEKSMNAAPTKTPDEIEYLTPEEVSARFRGRVSVRTLSNWRCLGTGPKYRKIGGRILYPVSEIEAYEQSRTAASTSTYSKVVLVAGAVLASPWVRYLEKVATGDAA